MKARKAPMKRMSARTAQRLKGKFLEAYSRLGNASAVQDETGISRYHHIRWMKQSAEYRTAFEAAEDAAIEVLEKEAIRRAVEGRDEDVYYCGQKVGRVKKYSDVLLIFLLRAKRPDIYREKYERGNTTLQVGSATKIVHEYHESGPTIDVTAVEQFPNRQLMSATETRTPSAVLTEHKVGKGPDTLRNPSGTGTVSLEEPLAADYATMAVDVPNTEHGNPNGNPNGDDDDLST